MSWVSRSSRLAPSPWTRVSMEWPVRWTNAVADTPPPRCGRAPRGRPRSPARVRPSAWARGEERRGRRRARRRRPGRSPRACAGGFDAAEPHPGDVGVDVARPLAARPEVDEDEVAAADRARRLRARARSAGRRRGRSPPRWAGGRSRGPRAANRSTRNCCTSCSVSVRPSRSASPMRREGGVLRRVDGEERAAVALDLRRGRARRGSAARAPPTRPPRRRTTGRARACRRRRARAWGWRRRGGTPSRRARPWAGRRAPARARRGATARRRRPRGAPARPAGTATARWRGRGGPARPPAAGAGRSAG